MLEIENLSFSYKKHAVLTEVSFAAKEGELICLLGKNGAGKTTLFKCILGFFHRYSGQIFLNHVDNKRLTTGERAKQIAYIPQSHETTYNYTVSEMVLMGTTAQMKGFASPNKKERADVHQVLERVGIAHLAERGYTQLSGGERQLVLIARALVQGSKILIMDEPTANLDYGNQLRVMELIKELAEGGYTVLLSTHTPEHALRFADQILILDKGSILAFGHPLEVLTSERMQTIYQVEAEVVEASASWGKVPMIVSRKM